MKKLIYIPLVVALTFEWTFTVLSNVFEVVAKGVEEICVNLQTIVNEAKSPIKKNSE